MLSATGCAAAPGYALSSSRVQTELRKKEEEVAERAVNLGASCAERVLEAGVARVNNYFGEGHPSQHVITPVKPVAFAEPALDQHIRGLVDLLKLYNSGEVDDPETAQGLKLRLREAVMDKANAFAEMAKADAEFRLATDSNPTLRMYQFARNTLAEERGSIDKVSPDIRTMSLDRFYSAAIAELLPDQIAGWVKHALGLTEGVPKDVQDDIVAMLKTGKQQSDTITKSSYNNGVGVLYRITFFQKVSADTAHVAVQVSGASFRVASDAKSQSANQALPRSLFSSAPHLRANAASTGISWEALLPFMDYLENLVSQQIWDRATPAEKDAVGGPLPREQQALCNQPSQPPRTLPRPDPALRVVPAAAVSGARVQTSSVCTQAAAGVPIHSVRGFAMGARAPSWR